MAIAVVSSGIERSFPEDEIIVSKTDTTGKITYANQTFLNVAKYEENEILGAPHSIIRHPDMPRSVFQLLWDTLFAGREIFAYVVNQAKDGAFYWVFAHVTPTFDDAGRIVGFHSNRRVPMPSAIDAVRPVYAALLKEEAKHASKKDAVQAGVAFLTRFLQEQGTTYDELVFAI